MKRNLIPDLLKVDWSDTQRQNEFVNSVVSALNALGEKVDYDYVCAVSGSAFRTSLSVSGWNHGNYHVINTPIVIEHTFRMLGYEVSQHIRGDYEADSKLIMDSTDRGSPVITLEGVISCADACVIAGYDKTVACCWDTARLCILRTITKKRRTIRAISGNQTGTMAFSQKPKDEYSSLKASARSRTKQPY